MTQVARDYIQAAIDDLERALAAMPADDAPATTPSPPVAPAPAQRFTLGDKSEAELKGVHPRLVAVVRRAIQLTAQDFTVHDGVRTLEQQRANLVAGTSKTLDSKHLAQADNFGHAVDLVPWVGGKPRWEWPAIYPIAAAMRRAAEELATPLTWGGAWDIPFLSIGPTAGDMEKAVQAYTQRHPGPDFIDGPHYQLRDA